MSSVEEFSKPKIKLEQYMTPPDITANMFSILHFEEHAIENKVIGDFCCGTGMYSIASTYFQPSHVIGLDIDGEALDIAVENVIGSDTADKIDIVQCDLTRIGENPKF